MMAKTITTSDQAATDVYNVLKSGNLKQETGMTGEVKNGSRALDSDLEDVVVSTLAMTAEQKQEGIINVNVFVKNLSIPIDANKTDTTRPNRGRLNTIANKAIEILESNTNSRFTLILTEPATLIRDPRDGNYFMNIRLRYHSIRLDRPQ